MTISFSRMLATACLAVGFSSLVVAQEPWLSTIRSTRAASRPPLSCDGMSRLDVRLRATSLAEPVARPFREIFGSQWTDAPMAVSFDIDRHQCAGAGDGCGGIAEESAAMDCEAFPFVEIFACQPDMRTGFNACIPANLDRCPCPPGHPLCPEN